MILFKHFRGQESTRNMLNDMNAAIPNFNFSDQEEEKEDEDIELQM